MQQIRLYSLISVFAISLVSLIWIIALGVKTENLKRVVLLLVSFSAWALLGDVFIHLFPEMIRSGSRTIWTSVFVLAGIFFGLFTEKVIHRNHCHMPITKTHVHPFAIMNLVWDTVHNFIDGLIIWASYLVSIPVGLATSIAVLFHEIPQEIGDFGVLVHGWFTKKKALTINFLTALSAFLGVIIALILWNYIGGLTSFLIPFAAGSFIYIAGSDLIPELHKHNWLAQIFGQLIFFLLGIGVMLCLLFLG